MAQLFRWWNTGNDVNSRQGADEILDLCQEILDRSAQHISVKSASHEADFYLINRHQCDFLLKRLSETQDTLADIQQSSHLSGKTIPVLQELHQALLNAERFIQSSSITTSEWLRAAIEQGDMKETFLKLLYDVQWHTSVLQSILVDDIKDSDNIITFESTMCTCKLTMEDKFALLTAMKKDANLLKERLTNVKLDDPIQEELANQLLSSTSSNLLFLNPQNLNDYYSGTLLGRGSFAEVRLTNFLGGEYAIKIFDQQKSYSFDQEMAALQGLGHHPHIVRLLCYSKNSSKCFLIMEKMDMELSTFLQRRNEVGKLSDVEAVVLMLEIAEGVRYIHSKRMAHRDLKPGNVLVNVEANLKNESLTRISAVRIADFGLTKIKNASRTNEDQTFNVGTSRYMAPEVIRADGDPERAELNSMKADVYSFAVMCSEILTGEVPFGELPRIEMKKQVKAGEGSMSRPRIPVECPERLASLIRRCWDGNFRNRPDFSEICRTLRYIKGLLLRGDRQKLETKDDIDEIGSLNFVHSMQEVKITNPQAISERRYLSLFFEQPIEPSHVRRVKWRFPVVLVLLSLLLLSIGVIFYPSKQRQAPRVTSVGEKKGDQNSIMAASMNGVRQGPWGRSERKKKTGLFDQVADSIKSIKLKYDRTPPGIGLLEVEYVKADGNQTFKERYGINYVGINMAKIDFESTEYLRQLSGIVGKYIVPVGKEKVGLVCVVSLTVHTNLRSYGPFGDEVGERFSSGTGRVIGFFGAAGVLLDKIGVWIIPDGQYEGDKSSVIED